MKFWSLEDLNYIPSYLYHSKFFSFLESQFYSLQFYAMILYKAHFHISLLVTIFLNYFYWFVIYKHLFLFIIREKTVYLDLVFIPLDFADFPRSTDMKLVLLPSSWTSSWCLSRCLLVNSHGNWLLRFCFCFCWFFSPHLYFLPPWHSKQRWWKQTHYLPKNTLLGRFFLLELRPTILYL